MAFCFLGLQLGFAHMAFGSYLPTPPYTQLKTLFVWFHTSTENLIYSCIFCPSVRYRTEECKLFR